MQIKKFCNIKEFLNSNEFNNKDLSYCDLSNLDLSNFPCKTWKNFKFYHTDFSNTNIQFGPSDLRKDECGNYILEYCNFTNCDLSNIESLYCTSIQGSNFTNTGLEAFLDNYYGYEMYDLKLTGVVFSKEMELIARRKSQDGLIDVNTVIINPQIHFSSLEIYSIIKQTLPKKDEFISSDKYEIYNNIIDKALEEDRKREGILNQLYNQLDDGNFSIIDKIRFFQGIISQKSYGEMDFSYVPIFLLSKIKFQNCKFNQIILPKDITIYGGNDISFMDVSKNSSIYTTIPHIIIPGFDASSWKNWHESRLDYTCFTTQTNLYLELGRQCNANCFFCRNQFLKSCKYDIEAISDNFKTVASHSLSNVVIGGGEPTLMMNDLLWFLRYYRYFYSSNYFVSTNGSSNFSDLVEISNYCNLNLSRHALEDRDNNKIFGLNTIGLEEIKKLTENIKSQLTLVATCFEGALDTVKDLERYIELGDYVHADAILFQTLHEDLNKKAKNGNQIDTIIFDEVIVKLKEQGYNVGEIPIYSTGDYKLIIVKSPEGDKTISFKKYITKEELEKEWFRAAKRTFDLSMAPNGDVYQNWHQNSDRIFSRKKKKY